MPTPSTLIESATFSDGTIVQFNENDIVVFVGPNNAGKSVALKNIKEKSSQKEREGVVIKDLSIKTSGTLSDLTEWLEKTSQKNTQQPNNPTYSSLGASIDINTARAYWNSSSNGLRELGNFFVYHLTTEARLNAANPAPSISLTQEPRAHPIHYMQVDDSIEFKISSYFRQAFGQDLIVHRNAGNQVPLYSGERPKPKPGDDRVSLDYIKVLEKLPTLHTQGDGMRGFVGVLLHSLIVNHTTVLIDEPEAFLHPPQARLLGRMLAEEVPNDRQLFIATHSGDFLRGLLDADSNRVRIIRLQREGDINIVSELDNTGIRKIWGDSLLRYSNILDGLFHNKVVIGESDSDSRFYAAMKDAVFDPTGGTSRLDVMFLHCGGKARFPTVIQSLRDLRVPISAVADFDVLNSEQPLRAVFESLGGNWSDIASDWSLVKSSIEQKKPELNSEEVRNEINKILSEIREPMFPKEAKERIQKILRRSSPWSNAKEVGKGFVPAGEPTQACNRLFDNLKAKGLFITQLKPLPLAVVQGKGSTVRGIKMCLPRRCQSTKEIHHEQEIQKTLAYTL